ncbi:MAG: Excinuclease ABC C subunit domain protein [Candidatus Curtissbacteria bacterium GW2011_GWA1_40_16]|uniref:Excinuclease ABC C subunit domain protein n=1 Tax=Candidatus Curtissbacteria bacterium GW2011_GWA1_40_16 TaxID=1618405 RepID=A0A0G0RLU5_9BACT|nr:MAG: Excinuclease ABC C subunit domain protein [Candidatus Curtissbacteria bacterium GW2011_GWA1_40_16]
MKYFVYVLQSLKDKKYYVGQTYDIEKRLIEHNSGLVRSTKSRTPFVLVGTEVYETRSEARWVEYNLKRHGDKKKKFIEQLQKEEPPARRASGPEGR